MKIIPGKKYQIKKGKTLYFKNKYGTATPIITIEDTDVKVFGGSWGEQQYNPVCLIYAMRSAAEGYAFGGEWYGKIDHLAELVNECELEPCRK
jgi:hypothetical protein